MTVPGLMCWPKFHTRLGFEAGPPFVLAVVAIGTMVIGAGEALLMNETAFGSEALQAIGIGTEIHGKIEIVTVTKSFPGVTRTTDGLGRIRTAIQEEIRPFGQIPEILREPIPQRLFHPLDPCQTS